ncbi:MAG: 4-vinyl reductase [Gemmatimonadota bacterium]
MESQAPPREILLPAPSLTALRLALRRETGAVAATHALNAAGFAAGSALFPALRKELGGNPSELPAPGFWDGMTRFFHKRGWGRISHQRIHPALGRVSSPDWAEADPDGGDLHPSCAYSAGLLAGLLSRVADAPMAAVEVACRSQGDAECVFLFGSEKAVQLLYGRLLDGTPLSEALDQL